MDDSAIIASGVNAAAASVGALSNGSRRQYKYQKRLMALQNQYNVENATTAYNRGRLLTQDSALLQKLGKQQAGVNTAFGQDGNVANAASAPQADGVSVPSPPDVYTGFNTLSSGVSNAVQNLISVATAKANIRKLTSEAEGNEIDNLTRNYLNLKKAGLMSSETRKNFEDAANRAMENKFAESRFAAEADSANSQAIINQADSSIRAAMNKADYDLKVQELFNKVQTGVLTQRQAMTELKKLSLMDSQISSNYASANQSNSSADLNRSNTEYNRKTMDNRVETTRLVNIPKDTKEILMRNPWLKKYMDTLDRGERPNYETKWHVDQLLLEYGLRDSKYKGINIGTIIDAVFR